MMSSSGVYTSFRILILFHVFFEIHGQGLFHPNVLLGLLSGLPRDPLVCEFQCPFGQEAISRAGHVPRYNGCGTYGIEALVVPGIQIFQNCCNVHDVCYDSCGNTKSECDSAFRACLLQRCNTILRWYNSNYRQAGRAPPPMVANCMSTAQLLGQGPVMAGCNPYMIAQMNACDCQYPSYDNYYDS